MPEHYTKNTLGCSVWCTKCHRETPHRVDDGRRGPCLTCLAQLEAATEARRKAEALRPPAAIQQDLFR